MPTPTAEEYARALLWNICGLRSEIYRVSNDVDAIRKKLKILPHLQKIDDSLKEEMKMQKKLYRDACKRAGLTP